MGPERRRTLPALLALTQLAVAALPDGWGAVAPVVLLTLGQRLLTLGGTLLTLGQRLRVWPRAAASPTPYRPSGWARPPARCPPSPVPPYSSARRRPGRRNLLGTVPATVPLTGALLTRTPPPGHRPAPVRTEAHR